MPRRASLIVFLGLASAIMLMIGISAGAAQETSQSKRTEVKDARERLMQARMDQSAAFESYNAALRELNDLDGQIAGTEKELQVAEDNLAQAQQELEDRASQVYKSGNVAFMDVLVGVDEFSDFATRLDLWTKLLTQERNEFDDVKQARDELKAQKDLLETQRAERAEAVEAAINRKEQAENSEADAQAYLDSLSGELRSLIQADQARRAEEARANAEKLRKQFAAQQAETPEPAPVQAKQKREVPEQQLSLQAQAPAPEPKPEPQPQEAAPQPKPEPQPQPQEDAPEPKPQPKPEPQPQPEVQPEPQPQEAAPEPKPEPQPEVQAQETSPQPDPELLAKQEEAERLAAERRAAAEQARAEQAEAERQAKLAAQRAENQQKAAERKEARERAAAAKAAQQEAERQAKQAEIEQAAAELAAQQAADRRAQRQAALEAQRQADLEAQQQADLREQRRADRAAQQQYEDEQAALAEQAALDQAALEEEAAAPAETDPTGSTTPTDTAAPVDPGTEQTAPTGAGPPASANGNAVVAEAAKYLGTPYVLGGWESCLPYEMMDCSCLTATVYQAFGFDLPDSPGGQMGYGTPVSGPPAAGDLLFWSEDGSGYITHVGIAMGDGTTIHASAYAGFVVSGTPIDAIPGYMGARRLL